MGKLRVLADDVADLSLARSLGSARPAVVRGAMGAAIGASSLLCLAGFLAGAVRVLPWILDPGVPWAEAGPFARGLAAVATESALLVGWPLGWALACAKCVEKGEARALQSLGESPVSTLVRLVPQGLWLTVVLVASSWVWGRDARSPGTVANDLLRRAKESCASASGPAVYEVPFTKLTWLCRAGQTRQARLVGGLGAASVDGAGAGAAFSAADASLGPDFRSVDLTDVQLHVAGARPVTVSVSSMSIRGLAPWAQASVLTSAARVVLVALTAWACALAAAHQILSGGRSGRLPALVLGVSGPVLALGLIRALERGGAAGSATASLRFLDLAAAGLIPLCAAALVVAVGSLATRLHGPYRAARE